MNPPAGRGRLPAPPSPRRITLLLAVILASAALLRLPALDKSPPGVWIDEAIGALQGDALVAGKRLPDEGPIRFPRWPVWSAAEGISARVFGPNIPATRLPAALAGLLAVTLCWPAARVFGGGIAGLVGSAFLAGSLWHATASRMALPGVTATVEGCLIGWLLLRDEAIGFGAAATVLLASLAAPFGYAASLSTPLIAVSLLAFRVAARRGMTRVPELALLACLAAAGAAAIAANPTSLERSVWLIRHGPPAASGWLAQTGRVMQDWVLGTGGWGYWHPFPPGSSRLSIVDLAFVAAGVAALTGGSIAGWKRAALGCWFVLSMLPEIAPRDGVQLLRGLPALAPVAIAAGCGGALAVRRAGRPGAFLVAGLMAVNAARTAWTTYGVMPSDRIARGWWDAADKEAADAVSAFAANEPVAVTPEPTYTGSPLLLFHLRGPLASGRIRASGAALADPVLARTIRDPGTNRPLLFVFRSAARTGGRVHLGVSNVDGLLAYGRQALAAGRPRDAEAHFRGVIAWCPDCAEAHGALGLALAAQGRWREAAHHLRAARSVSPPGSVCASALAEAERRTGARR